MFFDKSNLAGALASQLPGFMSQKSLYWNTCICWASSCPLILTCLSDARRAQPFSDHRKRRSRSTEDLCVFNHHGFKFLTSHRIRFHLQERKKSEAYAQVRMFPQLVEERTLNSSFLKYL
ncbi:hypothetical protein ZIOFF_063452 [Zingiber officinale]|uniref:Uncharacterized protein n=1 Tax=Zingiber officinale TaxID=94328 RepID=A0A8J5F1Y3_ZINOF|nr:hypothetical protein ZIOFF_063452 [Zingiber officinale]